MNSKNFKSGHKSIIIILLFVFTTFAHFEIMASTGRSDQSNCLTSENTKKKSLKRTFYTKNETIVHNNIIKSVKGNPISVTSTDMLELYKPQNDLMYYWTDEGTYQMNIGTADYENQQTWTMPNFPLNAEPTGDGIPIEDAPGLSRYPNATHCRVYQYDDNGDDDFFYEYYQFTETEVTILGFLDTIPAQEWSEFDDYNELVTSLPLDINTDFTTQSEVVFRDTIYNREVYVYTEGFGSLTTPYGTEEVLKVRCDVYETVYNLEYNLIDEYETTYITFYSKQGTRLALELEEGSTATGNVNIVDVQFERIIQNPTSIENFESKELKLSYPNPAINILNFNKIGNYQIYNSLGVMILNFKNVQNADISNLNAGIYFVKSETGKTQKIIVK